MNLDRKRYGPWAVVTGASDGIGRAFADELAAAGFSLVLVARRGDVLQALASDLTTRHNVDAVAVAADLKDDAGIHAVIEASTDKDVGLLVASAGFGSSGAFVDADLDGELQMIDVNCRAVAALAHHFGGRFARQQRGGLILLSSLVAFQGVPRSSNYAATKAWVQSFAEALASELKPAGVDVMAVAPGPVGSGFATRARMQLGKTTSGAVVARESLAALGHRTTVRPGWLSKLLGWSLSTLPRLGRVRVMKLIMGSMTRHPG